MARTPRPWFYRQTGWWMCWLGGKKTKLAKGKANKKQAEQRLLELRLAASVNVDPDSQCQTVASVIETYLTFAKKRLATSTLEIRTPFLQSFAEAYGWRPVNECKPHHMEAWLDNHPQWASDWTKNSAIRNVQVAFNWAAKSRLITENPFAGVTHRAGCPRRDMTPDEFRAILRATASTHRKKLTPGARFRQILLFLWYTGCRPSEARELEWSHIDFDNAIIVLPIHKTVRTQRVPRPRIIPLHPVIANLLHWIQRRNEGQRVFLTHQLNPWTKHGLCQRMRRACAQAGVPNEVKVYSTRHAFGTRAIVAGCDIKTLAELLGHSSVRMSEHYAHLAGQRAHLAAAMRQVNDSRRGG